MTPMPAQVPQSLLKAEEVCKLIGIRSPKTLRTMAEQGLFPKPMRLGKKFIRWPSTVVEDWIASRSRAASE